MRFIYNYRTGELLTRLTSDCSVSTKALTDNIVQGLRSLLQGKFVLISHLIHQYVISGVGGIGILFALAPKLTLLMLSVIPPVAIGGVYYGKFTKKISRKVQDALARSTAMVEEKISNIRTVKSFTRELFEISNYNDRVAHIFDLGKNRKKIF
jgi:ABC-type multidrug transport system fused ATPase/permease subunit